MNKIHRSVYSEVLGAWIAVSEISKNGGRKVCNEMANSILSFVLLVGSYGVMGNVWSQIQEQQEDSQNQVEDSNAKPYGYKNLSIKSGYAFVGGNNNVSSSKYSLVLGTLNFTGDRTKFLESINAEEGVNGGLFDEYKGKIQEILNKHNVNNNLSNDRNVEMIALGFKNFALNQGSIVAGNRSISSGSKSIVFGNDSVALNEDGIAIGTNAYAGYSDFQFNYVLTAPRDRNDGLQVIAKRETATAEFNNSIQNAKNGRYSEIAIGNNTVAMGREVVSLGSANKTFGTNSSAIGKGNFSHGDAAHGFGNWNISYGSNTVSVGNLNDSIGDKSLAAGFKNSSYGNFSLAVGYENKANSIRSTAIGFTNKSNGENSASIGTGNIVGWNENDDLPVHRGFNLRPNSNTVLMTKSSVKALLQPVNAINSVSIGYHNASYGQDSSSIGVTNMTLGNFSVALGNSNFVQSSESQAIGFWNTVKSQRSSAMGFSNIVDTGSNFSSAIGHANYAAAIESHAVGGYNFAMSNYGSAFGVDNDIYCGSNYSNAFGYNNTIRGISSNAIGTENNISAQSSIALGTGNSVTGMYSIAIGSGSVMGSGRRTSAANKTTISGNYSISMGHKNNIDSNETVALGNYIVSNQVDNSVILGNRSIGTPAEQIQDIVYVDFGGSVNGINLKRNWSGNSQISNGSVSFGVRGKERQLKNVATGNVSENSTDAINGSQLYSVIKLIGQVPINFVGDNSEAPIQKFLGQTLRIYGEANTDSLSDSNIGVISNQNQIMIKLSKVLQDLTSVSINGGTILDTRGLRILNGPTFTSDTINANGLIISNVNLSRNPNDAANVEYVNEKYQYLKSLGYTFMNEDGSSYRIPIGETIKFLMDENLNSIVTQNGVSVGLKKIVSGLNRIEFVGGPVLDTNGLVFDINSKFTREGLFINDEIRLNKSGLKVGAININKGGIISGLDNPSKNDEAANKKYVDDKFKIVNERQLSYQTNNGLVSAALDEIVSLKGADQNSEHSQFDSSSIMTWSESGVIRIGVSKNLNLSTFIAGDLNGTYTQLGPDSLLFRDFDENRQATSLVSIKVDSRGLQNIDGLNIPRLKVNEHNVATLLDGIIFESNQGKSVSVALNKPIKIYGDDRNRDISEFDGGKNIITMVDSNNGDVKYRIAFKKTPELDAIILKGSSHESNLPMLSIKEGQKNKITATLKEGSGVITVVGSDSSIQSELRHDGLYLINRNSYSKLGLKANGKGGVQSPDINKIRIVHTFNNNGENETEEVATLNDGLIFSGNSGEGVSKLNNKVIFAGADANTNWNDFDEGKNIMTKVETKNGETVIRIAMRKDLKLKNGSFGGDGTTGELKLKDRNGKDGLTLNPDRITFNNITKLDENGNPQKNGSAGLSMTQNGKSDLVKEGPATRILITDSKGKSISEVATMNDGLKFGANTGDEVSNLLNSKVIVAGNKQNNDWTKFDEGKNIMTKVEQNKEGQTDITIALKRDIELDSATFGHGATTEQNGLKPKEGKDGRIKLVNKDGKTTIQIDAGKTNDSNGPAISINKPDSEEGSKLTSEGFEIRKKSHKTKSESKALSKTTNAFVSIAPEGSARIEQDASQSRPRLTLKSGEGESAITEEIATMNDGLRFRGDSEELINKTLSSTLSIVGGETDATKLTLTKEDKNIGVIVEDSPRAAKDKDTKSQKVLAVRLSKNLKGLQSAEFKPVDENGKPTGQTITIGKEGLTFSNKDKKSQFNEEGLKIGENGPSVTDKGINAGGMNISNVAPPTQPHHASTRGYVDTQVRHLESKINERYKDALGASAMAMATSGLMPPSPGKSAFAIAGAVVAGQPAFAMGLTSMTENGKLMLKGAVASDARGQVGGLVGAAYQW